MSDNRSPIDRLRDNLQERQQQGPTWGGRLGKIFDVLLESFALITKVIVVLLILGALGFGGYLYKKHKDDKELSTAKVEQARLARDKEEREAREQERREEAEQLLREKEEQLAEQQRVAEEKRKQDAEERDAKAEAAKQAKLAAGERRKLEADAQAELRRGEAQVATCPQCGGTGLVTRRWTTKTEGAWTGAEGSFSKLVGPRRYVPPQTFTGTSTDYCSCKAGDAERREALIKNLIETFEKNRDAAQAGNAAAQLNLGLTLELGAGRPQNYKDAAFWFRKAAAQGNKDAILRLKIVTAILAYEDGLESEKLRKFNEAIESYAQAVATGDDEVSAKAEEARKRLLGDPIVKNQYIQYKANLLLAVAKRNLGNDAKKLAAEQFEQVVSSYPDTPQAKEAFGELTKLRDQGLTTTGDEAAFPVAQNLLRTATNLMQNGERDLAANKFLLILKDHPKSPQAKAASAALAKLKEQGVNVIEP